MSLKQPLVPQRQRATPRRLTTEPAKGGKELAKSKAALERVRLEILALSQRKKPANGTPAAQLDALMQSLYAKARHLIDLIAPDLFKSDDDLFKEFNNMDAIELAVLEVQEMLARRKAEYLEEAERWLRTEFNNLRGEHNGMERELQTKISKPESQRAETEATLAENMVQVGNHGLSGCLPACLCACDSYSKF